MTEATVCAILQKDGKFLLVKRVYDPYKGRWCLPGGHVDEYELAQSAVAREVKEETNLDFKPKFYKYFDEILRAESWHAVVLIYTGQFSGEEKPGEDSGEVKWFTRDEIKKMNLAFNHKFIINDFIKNEENK